MRRFIKALRYKLIDPDYDCLPLLALIVLALAIVLGTIIFVHGYLEAAKVKAQAGGSIATAYEKHRMHCRGVEAAVLMDSGKLKIIKK